MQAHAVSNASVAKDEALLGPPVRWRSAHRRCFGSHFSRHGSPVRLSVGAGRSLGGNRRKEVVGLHAQVCVPELAQSRSAKQTFAVNCPSSVAMAESKQFASVAYGAAALNTCPPAPNLPVKRTC